MRRRRGRDRSIHQRVGNRGHERSLGREDAFVAYVMDRFLYRLGRSRHAGEFILKGGVLVANLVDIPHRFTRDIDVLRRRGPPDLAKIRLMFREIVAVEVEDGVLFRADDVRAVTAEHDEDGYDGVKVFVRARVGQHQVALRVDIGFGDAVVPPSRRLSLTPFLEGDEPARVMAYGVGPVIAEKVQTVVTKFPVIRHRLKDLLDVVVLTDRLTFNGSDLMGSLRATFERRRARIDVAVLDDMRAELRGRAWETAWATMLREKAVTGGGDLRSAVERFDLFLRPLMMALSGTAETPERWSPGGPWVRR